MCHLNHLALRLAHAVCQEAHDGTRRPAWLTSRPTQRRRRVPPGPPPYISFATLLTFLKALKTDGIPPQIDRSVMSKMPGGVQGQMKLALRSLGLMEGDAPTPNMAKMVNALDTEEFESVLLERLWATYPYVFKLDLTTATPTMLADAFKVTGAKEDVSRKCRTFFLHAAKRAGVPLGNRLLTGSVPRNPSNGTRKKRKAQAEAPPLPPHAGTVADVISEKALEYRLVDLMSEAAEKPEVLKAIIDVVTFLKTKDAAPKNTATDQ